MKKLIIISLLLAASMVCIAQFDIEANIFPIPVPAYFLNSQTSVNYGFQFGLRTGIVYENIFDYHALMLRAEQEFNPGEFYKDHGYLVGAGLNIGYAFNDDPFTYSVYLKQEMRPYNWDRLSLILYERFSHSYLTDIRWDIRIGFIYHFIKS
ncbi:MAG: hypothetical protein PHW73_00615 [Atribacterota bacterium]|nr:hypothetical protein [Atribacterota bacterium]